tara:strand:+ start:2059 stop:2322 length:264 start_codon:yes stop_codon:yes gene_type:complete
MNKRTLTILTVVVITSSICLFALTYSNLRDAYAKAEKEKLEYCEKYHEQKNRMYNFIDEIRVKDSVIDKMKGVNYKQYTIKRNDKRF